MFRNQNWAECARLPNVGTDLQTQVMRSSLAAINGFSFAWKDGESDRL